MAKNGDSPIQDPPKGGPSNDMSQIRRGYKIRYYVSGKGKDGIEYRNYSLTVPSNIAEALPKDMHFLPKMTDEGLLFEPIDQRQIELPEWARGESNGNNQNKAA